MGIKSLTKTIKTNSPSSIKHENLYKLSGKKVAVDAISNVVKGFFYVVCVWYIIMFVDNFGMTV